MDNVYIIELKTNNSLLTALTFMGQDQHAGMKMAVWR